MDSNKIEEMYKKLEENAKELFGEEFLPNKSQPYLDKSYSDKIKVLREYSTKDEINDCVCTLTDECIRHTPSITIDWKGDVNLEIDNLIKSTFNRIINIMGFDNNNSMWNTLKDFLIDGFITFEIIWDDKNENILNFNRLKPDSLTPAYDKEIGNYWIQYPTDFKLKRILYDSQVIFLSYSSGNEYTETSYVERLIKHYNNIKTIEQSMIMFNIINATVYQKFNIPIKGLSKTKAEEQIGQLIANYSEHVEWDDTIGELKINGSKNIPFQKQYWFPDGDMGTPEMENLTPPSSNVDMKHLDTIKYFEEKLRKASRIPEKGNEREEMGFKKFVKRIQKEFKQIIDKPLQLQLLKNGINTENINIYINI